jgi:hypothetical protein
MPWVAVLALSLGGHNRLNYSFSYDVARGQADVEPVASTTIHARAIRLMPVTQPSISGEPPVIMRLGESPVLGAIVRLEEANTQHREDLPLLCAL